jgi:hypothetical protein
MDMRNTLLLFAAFLTIGISGSLAPAQNQPGGGSNNNGTGVAQGGGRRGRGNLDPGKVFTRPSNSPGLGKAMELAEPDADGFRAMFNGTDLSGWDALPSFWSVRDGALIASKLRSRAAIFNPT